jgi:regulator of replication initiation timing
MYANLGDDPAFQALLNRTLQENDPAFQALLNRTLQENEALQLENTALRQTLLALQLVLNSCELLEENE